MFRITEKDICEKKYCFSTSPKTIMDPSHKLQENVMVRSKFFFPRIFWNSEPGGNTGVETSGGESRQKYIHWNTFCGFQHDVVLEHDRFIILVLSAAKQN